MLETLQVCVGDGFELSAAVLSLKRRKDRNREVLSRASGLRKSKEDEARRDEALPHSDR